MLHDRPPTRATGYTLLELVLASAMVGGLCLSAVLAMDGVAGRAAALSTSESTLAAAQRALRHIEHAIRHSFEVGGAGAGVLKLETRHAFDLDDDIEVVGYTLIGSQLVRTIDDPKGGITSEVLLDGVLGFSASYIRIQDTFDAERFGTGVDLVPGLPEEVDTRVAASYTVDELGRVDPSLLAAYREGSEDLALHASNPLQETTATVTPLLDGKRWRASIDFRPEVSGAEFRPLVYGAALPDSNNLSVVFGASGAVRLHHARQGVLLSSAQASVSWNAGVHYRVELRASETSAMATLRSGGRSVKIGTVALDEPLAAGRMHLQVVTYDATGAWDNLAFDNQEVALKLMVSSKGASVTLHGGAVSRQP